MKYLVVDNGTRQLASIRHCLRITGQPYTIEQYSPYRSIDDTGYDCIVLSGGMAHEVNDSLDSGERYFERQFDMIRNTDKPIVGICLGLQMINVAFGGSLRRLPELVECDEMPIDLEDEAAEIFESDRIHVFKRHQYALDDIASPLEVLCESSYCTEIVRHTSKPIIGTQFHPEVYPEQFSHLLSNIVEPTYV